MTTHSGCSHPNTKAARAACRRASQELEGAVMRHPAGKRRVGATPQPDTGRVVRDDVKKGDCPPGGHVHTIPSGSGYRCTHCQRWFGRDPNGGPSSVKRRQQMMYR